MIFLSHSGKDKNYVKYIADKLGEEKCVYDNYSFRSGNEIVEEMIINIDNSKLFVIFISNESLNSSNVLFELEKAKKNFDKKRLRKIFPIIIDEKINYKDKRIPKWLSDNYNLKPIMRPSVALRRIKEKALEVQYELFPEIKIQKNIFIGRDSLIQKFQQVVFNYNEEIPSVYIASGLEKIGRSSFLKEGLLKTNKIDITYQPPIIELDDHESLEDFIIKLYDLGFSKDKKLENLMEKSQKEKIQVVLELLKECNHYNEKIFIRDRGSIVLPDGKIVEWFKIITESLGEKITFLISSKFRVNIDEKINKISTFSIPELTIQERSMLFSYYLELEKIKITREQFKIIVGLLTGLPEQIKYAIMTINDKGINYLINHSYLLVKYNTDKITVLLKEYEEDEKKKNFLILLSSFDYIGLNFLLEIVQDNEFVTKIVKKLYDESIIEYIGVSKEYLRLNDAVRDYTSRLNLKIPKEYEEKLRKHVISFLKTYKTEEKDAADFFFSMKNALLNGDEIDSKYLIPSHFLKTMVELYNKNKDYNQVIKLADRVLENAEYLDEKIVKEIRYYLCLSLIRLRTEEASNRFLKEVESIKGYENNFLMGYYYRIKGKPKKSISYLQRLLKQSPNFSRAKRELVQVLLNIEDYESAYDVAKENYENYPNNPYHIQAYLKCLIKKEKREEYGKIIQELLKDLKNIISETSNEMYIRGKALYEAYYNDDKEEALANINRAIQEFPNSIHAFLEKFDILYKYGNVKEIEESINEFKIKCNFENSHKKKSEYHMLVRLEIKKGNKELARTYLNNLKDYPEDLYKKLEKQIENIE